MGILSSSVSITRYRVQGKIDNPVISTVETALKKNTILEIDNEDSDKTIGWTSFETPFTPNFEGSSFMIGTHFIFSMRIDKKSIPNKIIQKNIAVETKKKLDATGRKFLSKNEKKEIKDHVIHMLSLRIPATPNVYDLIWNYEDGILLFFSNLKNSNEELETLFSKSFKLTLVRLFPFSMAQLTAGLSQKEKDDVEKISPAVFSN